MDRTYIPNRLKSAVKGGFVTGASDIIDDNLGKNQESINSNTYRKSETYSQEQINNIVSRTPETDTIVIDIPAASQDDIAGWLDANTPSDIDPETGRSVRANKLYRVPGPTNTTYSEWAWDGTEYIMLANKDYGIDRQPKRGSGNAVISDTIYGLQQKISDVTPNIYNNKAWHHSNYLNDRDDAICSINEFPVTAGESITWVCGAASIDAHNCALIFCDQNGDALTEEWYAANAYKRVISVPEGAYYAKASFVKGTFGSGVFDENGNPIFIPCSENGIDYTIKELSDSLYKEDSNAYLGYAWHHNNYPIKRNDAVCSKEIFEVTAGTTIRWICGTAQTEQHNCVLIFCDSNGDPLNEGWYAANANERLIEVPAGAVYAKASFVLNTPNAGVYGFDGSALFIPKVDGLQKQIFESKKQTTENNNGNVVLYKGWHNSGKMFDSTDCMCTPEPFTVTPQTIVWRLGDPAVPGQCDLLIYDAEDNLIEYYGGAQNPRTIELPMTAAKINVSFAINGDDVGIYDAQGNPIFIPVIPSLQHQIFDNDNDIKKINELTISDIEGNVYVGKGYHNKQTLKDNTDTVCTKELVPVTGGQTIIWVCGVAQTPGQADLLVYDTEGVFITDEYYAAYAEKRIITLPENAGFVHATFVKNFSGIGIYDESNNPIFIPVIPSLQNQILDINTKPGGSDDNVVGSYVGDGNTWVEGSKMTFLAKGGRYRISLADKDFARDEITIPTGQAYLFEVYNVYNGVETALAGVTVGHDVQGYYDFVVPEDSDYIGIGGRANAGVKVQYSIQQIFEDEGSSYGLVLPKAGDFAMLLSAAQGKIESFILFSDPHWFTSYNTVGMRDATKAYPYDMKKYWDNTPTDFVLCGGDWLIEHKKSVAVKDLAIIDGFMNKMFDFKYYPVYGNHDNNYQGEQDGTDDRSANDGVLTNQQMINLWFRKYGKMYYTFNGINTKFYVFDSGLDWGAYNPMNEYKWQQIDWFANSLLSGNDDNVVAVLHIVERTAETPSQFGNDIAPLAQNVSLVAQAFNSKTSITLNGVTYNFSGTTGKVRCIICGHTHFDTTYVLNDIPVFCETTSMNNLNFDLVVIDYNEYKLKSIRIGQGEDRIMNIVQ